MTQSTHGRATTPSLVKKLFQKAKFFNMTWVLASTPSTAINTILKRAPGASAINPRLLVTNEYESALANKRNVSRRIESEHITHSYHIFSGDPHPLLRFGSNKYPQQILFLYSDLLSFVQKAQPYLQSYLSDAFQSRSPHTSPAAAVANLIDVNSLSHYDLAAVSWYIHTRKSISIAKEMDMPILMIDERTLGFKGNKPVLSRIENFQSGGMPSGAACKHIDSVDRINNGFVRQLVKTQYALLRHFATQTNPSMVELDTLSRRTPVPKDPLTSVKLDDLYKVLPNVHKKISIHA